MGEGQMAKKDPGRDLELQEVCGGLMVGEKL